MGDLLKPISICYHHRHQLTKHPQGTDKCLRIFQLEMIAIVKYRKHKLFRQKKLLGHY